MKASLERVLGKSPKTKGETSALAILDPVAGRLSVQTVERLHRVLAGDPRTEQMVADYIKFRWQAKNLFYIPANVAREILRRPADFIRAAKNHCEPELKF